MKLQTKPERWLCLATSFAMALDMEVEEMLRRLGHNGGRLLNREVQEPLGRRGHHVQECIRVAVNVGFSVTPCELFPTLQHSSGVLTVIYGDEQTNWSIFEMLLRGSAGVITGRGRICNHAVAYCRGRVFDPDGQEYIYSKSTCARKGFYPQCLWIVR